MAGEKTSLLLKEYTSIETSSSSISPSFTLTWCNLSVWVKKKKKDIHSHWWSNKHSEGQRILNNVNGICKPGCLLAIMGSSGGGKTTLLATLSQRMKVGKTQGDIFINGHRITASMMNKISGFVPQKDLVVESLNVSEHMSFMAALRMDRRTDPQVRCLKIDSILHELGLNKCKRSRLSTLSGGERKKVSLAVQLLTDPPLLFCDEPTTGLDSYNANSVIEILKMCAEHGKTVLCTIHQPASSIFDMFSQVLLLAGGRVAYQGDTQGAANHFNSIGSICPVTYNKAEFYITQLAVVPGQEEESMKKNEHLCDIFDASKYGTSLLEELTKYKGRRESILTESGSTNTEAMYFTKNTSMLVAKSHTQLKWLIWRSFVDLFRNYKNHLLQFVMFLFIALLISTPYTNIASDQSGIQNRQGLFYLVIAETVFTFSYGVLHTFPYEMHIFLREIGAGIYKPGPYYISKMIVFLPQTILEPFVYGLLVYYITGMSGGLMGMVAFIVPVIFCALSASAYGLMISALFDSVAMATLLSVPIDLLVLVSCGIFMQLNSVPMLFSWIRYVSQFFYGIEAISVNQWVKVEHIECFPDPSMPCISSGKGVLEKYGYNVNNYQLDLLGLACIYWISHFLGFIIIWRRSKNQPIY